MQKPNRTLLITYTIKNEKGKLCEMNSPLSKKITQKFRTYDTYGNIAVIFSLAHSIIRIVINVSNKWVIL